MARRAAQDPVSLAVVPCPLRRASERALTVFSLFRFSLLPLPAQASGEAHYVDDKPIAPKELFGAFVLADTANAVLSSIDTSAAMIMPGVAHMLTAKDIPGLNTHAPHGFMGVGDIKSPAEPLFVAEGDRVLFNGQAIGMILAATQEQANAAAKVRAAPALQTAPCSVSFLLCIFVSSPRQPWLFSFPCSTGGHSDLHRRQASHPDD